MALNGAVHKFGKGTVQYIGTVNRFLITFETQKQLWTNSFTIVVEELKTDSQLSMF